jgi:hypothetical protein
MKHADAVINGDAAVQDHEIMFLEDKLLGTHHRLEQALERNEALVTALAGARGEIASLRDEIDKLCAPP